MKKEEKLLSYVCEKFDKGEYKEALEAFILAYEKGYKREWVLENIYNCYMAGNEAEFQEAYKKRTNIGNVDYKDCMLDFVPYKQGEYYIFDKKAGVFLGLFSVPEFQTVKPDAVFDEVEFSAVALALDWDIRQYAEIFSMVGRRKIYLVCHDRKRYMSFWKIPELEGTLKNIIVFSDYKEFQAYFHENTSVYLPMILSGSEEDCKYLERIRQEEHQYRLTPQGRNTDNVLLTIAIPTRHRGNLLLKRLEHLQTMPYDAEIEIAVSKNGSDVFEEEYTRASETEDARIRYYDHRRDLLSYQNFQYVIEMSCGRYVMLVSDEDDVNLDAMEHYLGLLKDNSKLSLVRAKSTYQYSYITQQKYGKKGLEAFNLMFLKQNYISGMIVRRKDFVEENFSVKFAVFSDNPFFIYYSHEWWCAMLCGRGDAVEEPVTFIIEGKSADQGNFPSCSTYEARLKQFQGMAEFLNFIFGEEKIKTETGRQVYEKCLQRIISKTVYLFDLARSVGHDVENYVVMVDRFASAAISVIEEVCLDEDQKMRTLYGLKLDCEELLKLDRELKVKKI